MNDVFYDVALQCVSVEVLLLLTCITALKLKHGFFGRTLLLLAFSVVINVTLKGFFKMPLPEWLHSHGYAFPSGHMQMASVFYVWMALSLSHYSRGIWLFVFPLLLSVGAGLMHYGYHDGIDVLGGFITGTALALGYAYSESHARAYMKPLALILASLGMLCNIMNYAIPPVHASLAYYVLVFYIILKGYSSKGIRHERMLSCYRFTN